MPQKVHFLRQRGKEMAAELYPYNEEAYRKATHDVGTRERRRGPPHRHREVLHRLQAGGGAPRPEDCLARLQRVSLPLPEEDYLAAREDVEALLGQLEAGGFSQRSMSGGWRRLLWSGERPRCGAWKERSMVLVDAAWTDGFWRVD